MKMNGVKTMHGLDEGNLDLGQTGGRLSQASTTTNNHLEVFLV